VHVRDAVLLGERSDLLAEVCPVVVGVRVARVLVVVIGGETDAYSVGANCVGDGFDDFDREADAVFDGAAVGVGALVDVVVEELLEEIAVGAVYLSIL
jgi:hypothetical protein